MLNLTLNLIPIITLVSYNYVSVVVSCICAISRMQGTSEDSLGEPYYTDGFPGKKTEVKKDGSLLLCSITGFREDNLIQTFSLKF